MGGRLCQAVTAAARLAATGELFYHSNIKTPRWVKYFIQTPELHSIHHQLDVHRYNFAGLPLWDRLFGTYRNANQFAERCGFSASQRAPTGPHAAVSGRL
jgi:sterol desaturase/sphingolipid hydroxylase (fatty acid hydroxylase superfamily)